MSRKNSLWACPCCGAEVSPNAAGCRECGAGKIDGRWESREVYDGIDLPGDDDFDYDEFVQKEFGEGKVKKTPVQWFWWIVAVILLLALVSLSLAGFW